MQSRLLAFLFLLQLLLPTLGQAEFYVIGAGGRIAGTEIKSLPYTINSSGFYYITKELTCPAGNTGITIESDDVTLDLMGFTLVGQSIGDYDGIIINGRKNVEIRNGCVRNFPRYGISGEVGCSSLRIINMRTYTNGSTGIGLVAFSSLIQGCISMYNTLGIYAGENATVRNCSAIGNTMDGIFIGSASIAVGNTSNGNHGSGISTSGNVLIKENVCYNNSDCGITTRSPSLIVHNMCNANADNIVCTDGADCVFVDNIPAP